MWLASSQIRLAPWVSWSSVVTTCWPTRIAAQLHGLLIRLDDRLPAKDVTLIREFIDASEFGLALEQMADVLGEDEQPLAADERQGMLALVARMQMSDRVPQALTFCPESSRRHALANWCMFLP